MPCGLGVYRGVCENPLHRRLRVVEVAAYPDRVHVRIGGRRHLQSLNTRRARRRVEDNYFRPVHARETLHRRRTRVAARSRQYEHSPPAGRMAHEDREHRERDVLERARPAVEEFQYVQPVALDERNWILLGEAGAETVNGFAAHCLGKVVEERPEDQFLGLAQGIGPVNAANPADAGGKIESAVGSEPPEDSFCARGLKPRPRRHVGHFAASSRSFSLSVIRPADASALAAFSPSSKRNTKTAFSPLWNAKA